MCSVIWAATPIAWPSPTIAWSRLLTERSRFVGAIPLTTTSRNCCLYLSMSSYAASCCICFPKVSCASVTSASLPIADVPPPCHFAFSCSARHHMPSQREPPPVRAMLGFAPKVVGRSWGSNSLQPRGSSSVLRRPGTPSPHEASTDITKLLRASARYLSLCLPVQPIPLLHSRGSSLPHHI